MRRVPGAGLLLAGSLGIAHGVADGSVGMQLGGLNRTAGLAEVAVLLLLYNTLAFGSQPLLGMLADRVGRPRWFVLGGLLLHMAALLLSGPLPALAVGVAGLGSAAFHVGGGALAILATQGRATGPGLFAAPGVIGLVLGGLFAARGWVVVWPMLILLGLLGCVIVMARMPAVACIKHGSEPLFEKHDVVMLLLLAAIALRSTVWTTFQVVFHEQWDVLLAMAVAATCGKAAGGVLADLFGLRRWATIALGLSAPLLLFDTQQLALLLPGIALLQSATPACIAAVSRLLPNRPATTAGLTLGLAIAAGGMPMMVGLGPFLGTPPIPTLAALSAALAVWWSLRTIPIPFAGRSHAGSRAPFRSKA